MPVNQSTPKAKASLTKFFSVARTDSGTEKCVIPKDSVITGVYVIQATACDGTTGTLSIGYSGSATAIVNAFASSTNDAGYHAVGGKAGADVIASTKYTADKIITSTFTAGDSTSGGDGIVKIEYTVLGGGESLVS